MKSKSILSFASLLLLAVSTTFAPQARANDFPARQVTMIVPFAAGAMTDIVARSFAARLSSLWGQPVIVDNRPGAASTLGAKMVASADADGHTLLFTTTDTFAAVPFLAQHRSFRPLDGLVPIHLLAMLINGIVIHPSLPIATLPELVAYAKANPTALRYSSAGPGSSSHLAFEMLKSTAKIEIQHIPYRGQAPATTAVLTNETQIGMVGYSAKDLVDTNRLKMIAVAGPARFPAFPNVPTTAEVGYGKVISATTLNISAPIKTPRNILQKIDRDLGQILNEPEMRRQLVDARGLLINDVGLDAATAEVRRIAEQGAEMVQVSGADKE